MAREGVDGAGELGVSSSVYVLMVTHDADCLKVQCGLSGCAEGEE